MNGEFFGGGLGGGRTGRGGPGHALGRQAHQERQRRQQHNHAAEHRERVLVAEHGGLAQHDLVSLADGSLTGGCGGHPVLDQDLLYAVHEQRVRRAAGDHIGRQRGLVYLRAARDEGGEQRGSGTAAKVAREVGERGDLVGLGGRDADVVERADGDEDERQRDDLQQAQLRYVAKAGGEVELRQIEDAQRGDDVGDAHHQPRVHLADSAPGDKHHEHHHEGGGRQHHAGALGGVAQQHLQVLWDEHGRAEEHHAEDELQEDGGAEVAVLQQFQVDDGVLVVPLPVGEEDEQADGEDGGEADHGIAEPVLFLALVQRELEQADADGDQSEAHEVDLQALGVAFARLQERRVLHHAVAQVERQQADRDIDEEDPVPVEVVGDPAAEGRADGRRHHYRHAVERERLAAFFNGERVRQDGLFAGGQAAAAEALQYARHNQQRQRLRQPAQHGAGGKHRHAGHVEALAPNAVGEPAGDGQNDGAGDEVAGEHPGGFVLAGTEGAGHVRQRHVGDGGVEHLHERGQGHRDGDRSEEHT